MNKGVDDACSKYGLKFREGVNILSYMDKPLTPTDELWIETQRVFKLWKSYSDMRTDFRKAYAIKDNEEGIKTLIWDNFTQLTTEEDTGLRACHLTCVVSNLIHQLKRKEYMTRVVTANIMETLASGNG
jgi:hypothetical protein